MIGGKSQRVRQTTTSSSSHSSSETNNNQIGGRVGRPRKNQARRATSGPKELPTGNTQPPPGPVTVTPQVKPMSNQQKCFVLQHHCFLLRNLDKVYYKMITESTCVNYSILFMVTGETASRTDCNVSITRSITNEHC